MSLLPMRLPPETQTLGRAKLPDNTDLDVMIDHNWWLALYNMFLNSVMVTPTEDLPTITTFSDVADTDATVLQRPVRNLSLLARQTPTPSASDLPDIARALLLAQERTPPDPLPQAQPSVTITPGVSPYSYTAPFTGAVSVTGGTVSAIAIVRQGVTVATGQTAGLFPVSRTDQLQVTYTVAPTMVFLPQGA